MRILLVHNYYGSSTPSGENQVLNAELNLLLNNGHEVKVFSRHSDELRSRGLLGMVKGALVTPWNPYMAFSIGREVSSFKPDIVHVHNTFPLISPSIFSSIGRHAARILTLHNYRLLCPAAIPMRAGKVCTDCIEHKSVMPSLRHGCYRSSKIATLPLAANVALHRSIKTWNNQVDAFIALSDFQRNLMAEGGLPKEKIYVKPNFYPGFPQVVPWNERGNYVVFAGRLSPEKGVKALISAWRHWGSGAPELRLVGDGELRPELEKLAFGLPVRFLGQLSFEDAQYEISNARLQILPSEWFEGFPMVVREALAFGTPSAVSNLGPLPSIVKNGVNGIVFEPSNPLSIFHNVADAWVNDSYMKSLGEEARKEFLAKYTEDSNYVMLLDIYKAAIDSKT